MEETSPPEGKWLTVLVEGQQDCSAVSQSSAGSGDCKYNETGGGGGGGAEEEAGGGEDAVVVAPFLWDLGNDNYHPLTTTTQKETNKPILVAISTTFQYPNPLLPLPPNHIHTRNLQSTDCHQKMILSYAKIQEDKTQEGGVHQQYIKVSRAFAIAHNLCQGFLVHVLPIRCGVLILEQVVIVATSPAAYQYACALNETQGGEGKENSVGSSVGIEFKAKLQRSLNIVAQGGLVRVASAGSSFEYHVLECLPYLQGELDESTTVVIAAPKLFIDSRKSVLHDSSNAAAPTNTPPVTKSIEEVGQLLVSSFIPQKKKQTTTTTTTTTSTSTTTTTTHHEPLFRLTNPNVPPLPPLPFACNNISAQKQNGQHIALGIALLTRPLPTTQPGLPTRASDMEVAVTISTLRALHIFSGSMVTITDKYRCTAARIFGVDEWMESTKGKRASFSDNILYISPLVAFNMNYDSVFWLDLQKTNSQKTLVYVTEIEELHEEGRSGIHHHYNKKHCGCATEVRISRVKGTGHSNHNHNHNHHHHHHHHNYTTELSRFFRFPRLLKQNDIFHVTINSRGVGSEPLFPEITGHHDGQEEEGEEEEEGGTNEGGYGSATQLTRSSGSGRIRIHEFEHQFDIVAYFKVTKMSSKNTNATTTTTKNNSSSAPPSHSPSPSPSPPELLWVSTHHTTLLQEGSVHSLLPLHMRSYMADLPLAPASEISTIAGFSTPVNSLCHIFLPSLHSTAISTTPPLTTPPLALISATGLSSQAAPPSPSSSIPVNHSEHLYSTLTANMFSALVYGPSGSGKTMVVRATADMLGLHLIVVNCYDLVGTSGASGDLKRVLSEARECVPCVLLLENIGALEHSASEKKDTHTITNIFRDELERLSSGAVAGVAGVAGGVPFPLLLVGTTSNPDNISVGLRGWFRHELEVQAPDNQGRLEILSLLLSDDVSVDSTGDSIGVSTRSRSGDGIVDVTSSDISVTELVSSTGSFLPRDLLSLLTLASLAASHRVMLPITSSSRGGNRPNICEITAAGTSVTHQDISRAHNIMQLHHATSIGAPKVPSVSWDDVGGLAHAKKDILDTIQLPLEHPSLFSSGLRQRSGILLYGPPGTGKTLLAKAVATECSLNFLSVKGPELINMYVGESERNIREIFQKARNARPCVIFFDELDSLAPNRGSSADSGGVMSRIVSQFLTELDGLQKSSDLFVIGATNRPDLIDPALLRPGRFDRLLYLGISDSKENQLRIVHALTRKFALGPDVNLLKVVEGCPPNLTGADFYALCSDALLCSMKDMIDRFQAPSKEGNDIMLKQDTDVVVSQKHFLMARERLTPSVSEDELAYYKKVQAQFSQK